MLTRRVNGASPTAHSFIAGDEGGVQPLGLGQQVRILHQHGRDKGNADGHDADINIDRGDIG